MTEYFSKIAFLFCVALLLGSCSVTKKLGEDEIYLQSIDFDFENGEKFQSDLPDYIRHKPNVRALGVLPLKDWAYNEVPLGLDSVYSDYYAVKRSNRSQKLLDSLFVKYGYDQFVGDSKWISRQFYRTGAKPVVLDTLLAQSSAKKLEDFYFDRGYFDADIYPTYNIDSDDKKGKIVYKIDIGEPSEIVNYNQSIQNADMERLYAENMEDSEVKTNERFDVENLLKERTRLEKIYLNNGYYDFNVLEDELIFRVDSTQDKNLNMTLKIAKPGSDSLDVDFKKYYFGKIEVYADDALNDEVGEVNDDINYNGYHIKSRKPLDLDPRVFSDALVIEPGQMYDRRKVDATRKLIFDRENFTLTRMNIIPMDSLDGKAVDSLLVAEIRLKQKDKYDLELSFESSYSQFFKFGVSPGVKLLTRNVFGGGENWENTLRGTFGTINNGSDSKFFNAYDLSFETKLNFPRLLLPFDTEGLLPKSYNPKSFLGLGVSTQKNIGLGSRNYTANLGYQISPTIYQHKLNLFHLQFVKNTESDRYYSIFTFADDIREKTFAAYFEYNPSLAAAYNAGNLSLGQVESAIYFDQDFSAPLNNTGDYTFEDYSQYRNMIFQKQSITQDVFIQSFSYDFNMNQKKDSDYDHPWFVNFRTELAGTLPALYNSLFGLKTVNQFQEDVAVIAGVPYSQFVKFDLDVRKNFSLSKKSSIVLRNFMGISIPFGNSRIIPFSRAYFGGGSNDVRAWQAFELSPNPLRPDDNGTYIDNFKITWNAEYRFPMVGMFNGALFVDAGNIWGINSAQPRNQFKLDSFVKQLGIGAGFGVRLDFTFLIARIDMAYKIHNPAYPEGERWLNNVRLLRPQIQLGINYPF